MRRAFGIPLPAPWERIHTSRYPLGATTLRPDLRAGRAYRRDPLAFLQARGAGKDVFRFTTGFSEHVVVNSPPLIQRVLVDDHALFGEGKWTQRGHYVMGDCLITQEGEPHARRRAMLQPSFARSGLQAEDRTIVRCAERLAARWRPGEVRDLRAEMGRVALHAAALALFGADLGDEADELVEALRVMLHAVSRPPLPRPRLLAAHRRVHKAAARLTEGSMVAALREAVLPDEAIRDEVASMLLASVDTTPSTMFFLWWELARHPETEAALHAELEASLGGAPPGAADLGKLPYLKQLVSETLRMHPPVHFIDRRALEDVELGGHAIRAGEYMLLSPILTQRDARFHEEPEAFRPGRFAPGAREQLPRFAYFPFGAGPHVCIGMALADLEISLVVATLAQRWRLVPQSGAVPGLYPTPLPVRVEARA